MIDPAEAARKKRRHRNERIAASLVVLAALAGAAGVFWYSHQLEKEIASDVTYIPKPAAITPAVAMLREYVRIDTSTPQGIAAGAWWIASELAKRGVRAELIESTGGRLNVYARIEGRKRGKGLLLFNHIDVVPAGEGWQKKPFGAEIALNQLYGRGTLDMKGLAITQLLAFADVARAGRPPEHDLVFLATAEEEQGSRDGMLWLLEHRPDIFDGIAYGITEGGLTEVLTEKSTFFGIEVGGKQAVRAIVHGPDEESLRNARFVLQRYVTRRDDPASVSPQVRQHLRDLAPSRLKYKPLLEDIDGAIAGGQFWQLPHSYRHLMQDTLWATAPYFEGGQWKIRVVMMILPDADPAQRLAWLGTKVAPFGGHIAQVLEQPAGPAPLSPTNTRLYELLVAEARQRYRTDAGVQVLYRSQTDSRFLRPRGIVCYGVSPFLVDIFQSTTIHGADERIRLDWFEEGVAFMRDVVRTWAFPAEG